MNESMAHTKLMFKQGLRLYFAPLVGAIRGIRDEYRRIAELEAAELRAFEEEWGNKQNERRC